MFLEKSHLCEPGVGDCFLGSHSFRRVLDQQLANEVHHFIECVTLGVVLKPLVQVAGQHYLVIRCEQLLSCAQEVHDASEGPAVLCDVRVKKLPGLRGTPLLKASSASNLVLPAVKLHRDVEVYYFDAHVPIIRFIWGILIIVIYSAIFVADENIVWLQVAMADSLAVKVSYCVK